jgi:phosphatidate cytidylyltransferase
MRQRVLSAAVFVPLVAVIFLAGQPWLSIGLAALGAIAAWEASRLVRQAGFSAERVIAIVGAPVAVLGMPLVGERLGVTAGFVGIVVIAAAIAAFRRPEPREGFLAWLGTIVATLYPSMLAFVAGILVVAPPIPGTSPLGGLLDDGRVWLLLLVATVWAYDTFAYLVGKTYPRGRFLSHISPFKTWSGVVGGTVTAVVVSGVLVAAAGQPLLGGLVIGILVAVTAQAGDVAESLLKRAAGAKDSSGLIPGHGGVLDRIDSFLFAAPALYVALTWVQLVFPVATP